MTKDLFQPLHPIPSPRTEDEAVSWIRLLRSRRVGVSTFFRLLGEHGSAEAALDALPEVAKAAGVKDYAPCPEKVAEDEYRRAQMAGAKMICWGSDAYPALLSEISDPPPFFWAMGDEPCCTAPPSR